jgi:hypothetical protein
LILALLHSQNETPHRDVGKTHVQPLQMLFHSSRIDHVAEALGGLPRTQKETLVGLTSNGSSTDITNGGDFLAFLAFELFTLGDHFRFLVEDGTFWCFFVERSKLADAADEPMRRSQLRKQYVRRHFLEQHS